MSHFNQNATRAAVLASLAIVEHLALVWWATGAFLDDYRHPTDMPFGYGMALMIYLAVIASGASASWFYFRVQRSVTQRYERIQRTACAGVLAPWTIAGGAIIGLFLGPLGWVVGSLLAGAAPYFLLSRLLPPSEPHDEHGPDGEMPSKR